MALPLSGRIGSSTIKGEFGGVNPMRMSRYYRGGSLVPNIPANNRISTSGRIAHSMFYGARKEMSSQEATNDYINNINGYTRYGNIPNQAAPNDYYSEGVWPFHKHGTPGTFDWTYNFSNMGQPASDNTCTIVLQQCGRNPNSGDIQSITKSNGERVSFTKVFSRQAGDPYASGGWCYGVWHVNCDRREIARVVMRHYTWGTNRASTAHITILPTNKWKVTSLKSRFVATGAYIAANEVMFVCSGVDGGTNTGLVINTSPFMRTYSEWYNDPACGIILGNASKSFSIGRHGGAFSNSTTVGMFLKHVPDGESLQNHDRVRSAIVKTTVRDFVWDSVSVENIYNLHRGSTSGFNNQMVFGDVFSVPSAQKNEGEIVTIVSWTCDKPGIKILTKNGGIYAYPNTLTSQRVEWKYNATVTVRTQSGRVITGDISGLLVSYYSNHDSGG